jgi:hypothetical protein
MDESLTNHTAPQNDWLAALATADVQDPAAMRQKPTAMVDPTAADDECTLFASARPATAPPAAQQPAAQPPNYEAQHAGNWLNDVLEDGDPFTRPRTPPVPVIRPAHVVTDTKSATPPSGRRWKMAVLILRWELPAISSSSQLVGIRRSRGVMNRSSQRYRSRP